MIAPICLENLVQIGKWMGLAHEYIEMSVREQQAVIAGEDFGQGRKFKVLADYNLTEMDDAAERIEDYCPQMPREPSDNSRFTLQVYIESVKESLQNDDLFTGLMLMRNVEDTLMEWVNDIAFAEPSRHAVRR
jgi:hypothetical protein